MASIFTRLAALTEEFASHKFGREAYEAKLRAWKLAYELVALETRLPILKVEMNQALDALDKAVHPKEEGKK